MNRFRLRSRARLGDRFLWRGCMVSAAYGKFGLRRIGIGLERYRLSSQRTRGRDDGILGKGRHRSSVSGGETRRGRSNPNHRKRLLERVRRALSLFSHGLLQPLQSERRPHGEPRRGVFHRPPRKRLVRVRMALLSQPDRRCRPLRRRIPHGERFAFGVWKRSRVNPPFHQRVFRRYRRP